MISRLADRKLETRFGTFIENLYDAIDPNRSLS